MEENNKVGKGKPPKEHQWKPGQSGNIGGRPKGSKNLKTIFRQIAEMEVSEEKQFEAIAKMKKLFPEMFADGKLDVQTLLALRLATTGLMAKDPELAMKAIKQFNDRYDGRPSQTLRGKDESGEDVEIQEIDLGNGTTIQFK